MSWIVNCCKCKKKIYCSEKSYNGRMKKFDDAEDMKNNYVCLKCRPKKSRKKE